MRKLKPLRPTLRQKKRYLAFEIMSKQPVPQAFPWLADRLAAVLGQFGAAQAGIIAVDYDARAQRGLLKASAASLDRVKAAFLFLDSDMIVRSVGVSGILSKARRFLET